jgi:hypothetical protein
MKDIFSRHVFEGIARRTVESPEHLASHTFKDMAGEYVLRDDGIGEWLITPPAFLYTVETGRSKTANR